MLFLLHDDGTPLHKMAGNFPLSKVPRPSLISLPHTYTMGQNGCLHAFLDVQLWFGIERFVSIPSSSRISQLKHGSQTLWVNNALCYSVWISRVNFKKQIPIGECVGQPFWPIVYIVDVYICTSTFIYSVHRWSLSSTLLPGPVTVVYRHETPFPFQYM